MNSNCPPIPAHRRTGFTLIELLTVIAIIGILAAILIPVVGKVRQSARMAQCQGNLRQIGIGVRLFAQDNKGMIVTPSGGPYSAPGVASFSRALLPYVTSPQAASGYSSAVTAAPGTLRPLSVFACPASDWRATDPARNASDYGMNITLTQWLGINPPLLPIEKIRNPSKVYLVTDTGSGGREFSYSNPNFGFTAESRARHQDRVNMLYVDGSVRSMLYNDILFSSRGGTRDFAPWGRL
jgi:general secretion pathway protein G